MNNDILNNIINTNDMNSISVIQLIKITMEKVEILQNKTGDEKKLIVISILNDFIKIYDNSLAVEIKILLENSYIYHIIETFIVASKEKININIKNNKKCCFIS
jgi:hypothetical protein